MHARERGHESTLCKGAIYRPKTEAPPEPNSVINSNTVEKIHCCCLNPESLIFYGISRFVVFSASLFLCMPLYSPVVVTNFGCQHACIWKQLKPELLGSPVMSFLNQIIWSGKTYRKSGHIFWLETQIKGHRRRKHCFFPVCSHDCWKVCLPCLWG